uniref:G-protein coupled receptors family 1 profile domain-containing protein n=1 Tax=Parascaris univalens TaxID=6257 RepID=A0A914ZDE0_PARUN
GVMPLHIAALVLCVINFLLNGFICISFHYNRNLFYKCHLYIFFAFALINSLSGFATIPTIINLFFHNNLNCPRWTIIIGSGFEIALDRMRKLLTIAIAVERLYAVYLPSEYHLMDHVKFTRRCCIFATLWGLCDSAAMIAEDDLFEIRMHCVTTASSGPIFHTYFLISSIAFGLLLLFLYIPFVAKLCLISEASTTLHSNIQAYSVKTNYRQANSLTAMVVLSVLLFSVAPCALYFYDLIENKIVFMEAGPVVTIGYHMYGCSSFFIYNWQHRNIRRAMM